MPIQFKNINQQQPTSVTKKVIVYASLLFIMVSPAVAIAASPSPATLANSAVEEEAEPSPSATASDEELLSPEVIQKNKERLQRALQNQSDRIKGVLDDLGKRRKGLVGEVQRVSEETFTIKTSKATHIIAVKPETTILKANRAIELNDIAVGDWTIVVSAEQDDELIPERIIVSSTSLRPDPQVVALGGVTALNRTKTELTVRTRAEAEEKTFTLNRNTVYEDMTGNEASLADITEDVQVLVVATEGQNGVIASTIRILVPLSEQ